MPKIFIHITLVLLSIACVPPMIIARARTKKSEFRRIHYIQDMDNQARRRAQHPSDLFADGRAMRQPVEGTVARGELRGDTHLQHGVVNGGWATAAPASVGVDLATLERGQERFEIYCTMCHGVAGYGDGIVHQRAMQLIENPMIGNGTEWVQPKNMHEPEIRDQPIGQIYGTITNGIRNMAGYRAQVPVEDRWAIALYVKALQRSQHARPDDVSAGERSDAKVIDLRLKEEGGAP